MFSVSETPEDAIHFFEGAVTRMTILGSHVTDQIPSPKFRSRLYRRSLVGITDIQGRSQNLCHFYSNIGAQIGGIWVLPAVKITVNQQVLMYCGLSVKINKCETPHDACRSWTHFVCGCFCLCGQDPETLHRRPIHILIAPAAPSITGARSSDELHSILFSIGQLRSIHAIPRDLFACRRAY